MFHYLSRTWKCYEVLKIQLDTVPNWLSLLNTVSFAVSTVTYMNYSVSSENTNSSQDIFKW